MGDFRICLRIAFVAATLSAPALASPPPGVATPWNGPWGGGYMTKEPFLPWESPYYSAGYGFHYPSVFYGSETAVPMPGHLRAAPSMQFLPGGGYILIPGTTPAEMTPGFGRGN